MTTQEIFEMLADNEERLFYALCAQPDSTEIKEAHEAAKKALAAFAVKTGCHN